MALTINSTPQITTVEVVDTYAIVQNDNFIYVVSTEVLEDNGWLDEEVINESVNLFQYSDIVIRKTDKVVTKVRFC